MVSPVSVVPAPPIPLRGAVRSGGPTPSADVRRRGAEALLRSLQHKLRVLRVASRRWAPEGQVALQEAERAVQWFAAQRQAEHLADLVFALHSAQRRLNDAIERVNDVIRSLPGTTREPLAPFDAVAHPAFSVLGSTRAPRRFDPDCQVRLDAALQGGVDRLVEALRQPLVDASLTRLVHHGGAALLAWMGERQLRAALSEFIALHATGALGEWLADLHRLSGTRTVTAREVIEDVAAGVAVGALRRRFDRFLDQWNRQGVCSA